MIRSRPHSGARALCMAFGLLCILPWEVFAAGLSTSECVGIGNSYQCAQVIERKQLAKQAQRATRDGGVLKLRLTGDKWIELRDKDEASGAKADEVVLYSLRDYIESAQSFLIHNQYYEGGSYSLVSSKSGRAFLLDDVPIFSADYQRFITVSVCDAYCSSRIRIWRLIQGGWEIEWDYPLSEYWASGSAKWLNNQNIEIIKEVADVKASIPSKGKYVWIKKPFRVTLSRSGWALTE